jgi:4-amino-4-deoxy-L-arabinose transferase-like glycosyltransferase
MERKLFKVNRTCLALGGIIFLGILFSFLLAVATKTIFLTEFSDYNDDAEVYNSMARAIVNKGTLLDEEGNYYGWGRRAPGYPIVLAMAYGLYESPISAWILQSILFGISIGIFWKLARLFVDSVWSLIATMCYAIAWFIGAFVIQIASDFMGLFWGILFLWSFAEYFILERKSYFYLALAGISFGALTLTRPATLYFLLIIVGIIFYSHWQKKSKKAGLVHGVLFLVVSGSLLIPWMWWSYSTVGTYQLASAGYILAWRSRDALWDTQRMITSGIAAVAGDLVADVYAPGYAVYPDPYPQKDHVIERRLAMQASGSTEQEIDSFFYQEGIETIKAHPLKFLITGGINIFRLLTPPNHQGTSMTHFLVDSNLSLGLRVAANIFVRCVWLGFLGIGVWGFIRWWKIHTEQRIIGSIIGLFVLYIIGLQALVADAEFRYILPTMPFFILFFIYSSQLFFTRRGYDFKTIQL